MLRFSAITFVAIAGVTHLFGSYAHAVQQRSNSLLGAQVLYLARVVFLACATSAGLVFLFLSTNYDYCCRWGWMLIGIATVLLFEPVIFGLGQFYQPHSYRKTPAPIGSSVILDFLLGSGKGAKGMLKEFEGLVGMNLKDVWILNFLRSSMEGVLLAGLLMAWVSTCITSVPLGNRGVLISFGQYQDTALQPGLHVTLPWPFQMIVAIQSERLREISLGFDKDTTSPLLWTEQHVEGEKNLLVDNGEGLLTINVPVIYRISDAVMFLKSTTDAEMALKTLAERQLIQIAADRESFHFMTEDRQSIADALRKGVQAEVDRLHLGLEIVFVGLKDIHPPVTVAPAYQRVISAQEQSEAMVDDAKAYEARTLPAAISKANTAVVTSEAVRTQRVLQATGEAARFVAIVSSEKSNPLLFRQRLTYDALTETLATPSKTIIGVPQQGATEYFLDLRPRGDAGPLGALATP